MCVPQMESTEEAPGGHRLRSFNRFRTNQAKRVDAAAGVDETGTSTTPSTLRLGAGAERGSPAQRAPRLPPLSELLVSVAAAVAC